MKYAIMGLLMAAGFAFFLKRGIFDYYRNVIN